MSYLEQLFAKLRKNELVKSVRGPGGGYLLNGHAADISIASVIDAVNETTDVTACGGKANCHQGQKCIAHDLWSELSDQIRVFLQGITLQSVIEKQQAKATLTNGQVQPLETSTFILSQMN